jgi:hypothetical protein
LRTFNAALKIWYYNLSFSQEQLFNGGKRKAAARNLLMKFEREEQTQIGYPRTYQMNAGTPVSFIPHPWDSQQWTQHGDSHHHLSEIVPDWREWPIAVVMGYKKARNWMPKQFWVRALRVSAWLPDRPESLSVRITFIFGGIFCWGGRKAQTPRGAWSSLPFCAWGL